MATYQLWYDGRTKVFRLKYKFLWWWCWELSYPDDSHVCSHLREEIKVVKHANNRKKT